MERKVYWIILISSITSFFFVSVSVFMMAFLNVARTAEIRFYNILCGICFWVFLVLGIGLQIYLSRILKKWKRRAFKIRRYLREDLQIGIISFFKNRIGLISDIAFLVSVIMFIVSCVITKGMGVLCYISLALSFFSFCMHCIFNGKNYYCIINQYKIDDYYRKKMEESK